MRKKTRDDLEHMVHCAVEDSLAGPQIRSAEQLAALHQAVSEIKPVTMDLTQELADDIVTKLHGPLTIPQTMSDWIREQAQYHDIAMIHPLGYGLHPGTLQYVLRANGTLFLEFRDLNGADLWRGTFVPPDFGKDAQ